MAWVRGRIGVSSRRSIRCGIIRTRASRSSRPRRRAAPSCCASAGYRVRGPSPPTSTSRFAPENRRRRTSRRLGGGEVRGAPMRWPAIRHGRRTMPTTRRPRRRHGGGRRRRDPRQAARRRRGGGACCGGCRADARGADRRQPAAGRVRGRAASRRRRWRSRALTDEDIAWYVASGEGRDKAGGYAIQGLASRFIPRIDGSYSNVVGLAGAPCVVRNCCASLLASRR